MYYLLDEIIIPKEFNRTFLNHINDFRRLYLGVSGVADIRYLKTTLEAFSKSKVAAGASGAENLDIVQNPASSYLLLIVFKSQKEFQDYHDNSALSKQIHQKISSYFNGRQLTIRAALHGNEI